MAYVVARRDGRFEIRESVHTANGPRARSLANFAVLTEAVVEQAGRRASRPFDPAAVRSAAERAGAPVAGKDVGPGRRPAQPGGRPERYRSFVAASRRLAQDWEGSKGSARRVGSDPGSDLAALLDFADQVARHQPRREPEPLRFPSLAGLLARRRPGTGPGRPE